MLDIEHIEFRLKEHAGKAGDTAPHPVIDTTGAPSRELMGYCTKHSLTLDWAILGEGPMNRQPKLPKLADVADDATFLHGLLQGLEILITEADASASPASNAAYALVQETVAKCDRLSNDLSVLVDAAGRRPVPEAIQ